MSSRNMCLLPRATLHSDSEQLEIVISGLMGWEMAERRKSQRVGQLLPDWGPEWMGIRHHEQVSRGSLLFLQGHCVDID